MAHTLIIKSFKLIKQIKLINQKIQYFSFLILLLQYFTVMFFMVIKIQTQLTNSFNYLTQTFREIKQDYLTIQNAEFLLILGNMTHMVLLLLIMIRIKLSPNDDEISKYKKTQKILIILIIFINYLSQISIILVIWSCYKIYINYGVIVTIFGYLIPFVCYTYFSFKHKMISLYGMYAVPTLLVIMFIENPLIYLSIIGISLYLLIVKRSVLNKICYGQIILMSIYIMKKKLTVQEGKQQNMGVQLFFLSLSYILLVVLILNTRQWLNMKDSIEKDIQKYYDRIMRIKQQIISQQMKSIMNLLKQKNNNYMSQQMDIIMQKDYLLITKKQFMYIFLNVLQKESKKSQQNHIYTSILILKIKLEMDYSMNKVLNDLQILYGQIQKSNQQYMYEFLQLFDHVIHRFGIYKNNQFLASILVQTNQLQLLLQNSIKQTLQKLTLFWNKFISNNINLSQLDSNFQQVMNGNEITQQIYDKLYKSGNFESYFQAAQSIKNILNPYERKIIKQHKNIKLIQQGQQNKKCEYLILQNNIINFYSNDLIISLQKNGYKLTQNINKQQFFGQDFIQIINQLIQNITYESQKKWFTIPIVIKNSCIQIKQIKLIWYPSFQMKKRYLILFNTQLETINNSFLICDSKHDTIKYFNYNFINQFQINQQKLYHHIINYNIVFNQFFIQAEVLIQQIKNYLKQKSSMKCKLYLKTFTEKGTLTSIPVSISIYKQIETKKYGTYWILKVKQQNQKKLALKMQHNSQSSTYYPRNKIQKLQDKTKFTIQKQYQNELFYCKIQNPYQNKIKQKQTQLQETRWVYRYWIHILFGLIFCSASVFWILDCKFLETRINNYQKVFTSIQNVSQQYAILYQAYTVILKRYVIQKNPENTFLVYQIPYIVYDEILKYYQQIFLDRFINRYLTQINKQPNNPIKYQIDFPYFSISTNTSQSTLIDFAQNFQRDINYKQQQFLLNNYNNFRDLTIKYENSFSSQAEARSIIASSEIFIWILISFIMLLMILTFIVIIKIQNTLSLIYTLIGNISLSKYEQNLQKFDQKKHNILSLLERHSIRQTSDIQKSNKSSTQKSNSTLKTQKIVKDSSNLFQSNNQNQLPQQKLKKSNKSQSTFEIYQKDQQQFLINYSQLSSTKQNQSKERIIYHPIFIKLWRHSFFIVLFMIFGTLSYIDQDNFYYQQDGMIQLLQMKKRMYISMLHIKRIQCDGPIIPILKDYFNKSITHQYFTRKIDLVSQISTNNIILEQMKHFKQVTEQTFTANLCNFIGVYAFVLVKPCQQYLNGVITKGFRQVFDLYFEYNKIISSQTIYEFFEYKCTTQKCPPYLQIEGVGIVMGQAIRNLVVKYNDEINKAFELMINNSKRKAAYKTIGLLISLVIYILYAIKLRNRCRMGLQYFKVIPRDLLNDIKLTAFMKKSDFLNRITIL